MIGMCTWATGWEIGSRWAVWALVLAGALASGVRAQPSAALTEVAVMGMIHDRHRRSEVWGLSQVREAVHNYRPDVILTEIPPDRWDRVWERFQLDQVVVDSRVRRFPEYVDAVLHVALKLGATVEPCAAWTREMAEERREKIQEFENDPRFSERNQKYIRDLEAVQSRYPDPLSEAEDPAFIHSSAYDLRMKEELSLYDEALNDWIGPGGWTNINTSHMKLIDAAIDRHAGKRILITFGAGHKYWFLEKLRERSDVTLLDLRPYLRESNTMDELCKKEVLDLHQFFEDWFVGRLEDTPAAYSRFESVLADGFEMVSPEGAKTQRGELIDGLRGVHGREEEGGFRIWIENCRVRKVSEGIYLATYEECQRRGEVQARRLSTAVFREREGAPNRVDWLHVHETWVPSGKE